MSAYDKVLYYCGLIGIVISLAIIVAMVLGFWSRDYGAIGKVSVGLVVGTGLFIRGYRAKQKAKEEELIRQFSQRFGISIEEDEEDDDDIST